MTHPSIAGLLRWFEHEHLPPHLQAVVLPFHRLAHDLADSLPPSAELTTALRKLLESKDCTVRAAIP